MQKMHFAPSSIYGFEKTFGSYTIDNIQLFIIFIILLKVI